MRSERARRRALGVVLLLPLAAALVGSVIVGANCSADCGDQGGRGMFVLVLLCTPLAAAGLLALAKTRGPDAGAPRRGLARLGRRAVVTPVLLCALLLGGTALASRRTRRASSCLSWAACSA